MLDIVEDIPEYIIGPVTAVACTRKTVFHVIALPVIIKNFLFGRRPGRENKIYFFC